MSKRYSPFLFSAPLTLQPEIQAYPGQRNMVVEKRSPLLVLHQYARILPDGTVDFMEKAGKEVVTDGAKGRISPKDRGLRYG